jgi:hemerythrin
MSAASPPKTSISASRVGIPVIDEQHEVLVKLVYRLLERPAVLANNELVVDVLTDLGKFLILHFKTEEELMRQLHLPAEEYEAHVRAHGEILDQYAELNMAIAEGKRHTAGAIFEMTHQWLGAHLHRFDLRLADYAKPAG